MTDNPINRYAVAGVTENRKNMKNFMKSENSRPRVRFAQTVYYGSGYVARSSRENQNRRDRSGCRGFEKQSYAKYSGYAENYVSYRA